MSNGIRLKIRTKLLLFALLFFCVPFMLLGTIWYKRSTGMIEANAVRFNHQSIQQINAVLDNYFSELKNDTVPLLTNNLIQQFINVDADELFQVYELTRKIKNDLYPNIVYGSRVVHAFSILTNKGVFSVERAIKG